MIQQHGRDNLNHNKMPFENRPKFSPTILKTEKRREETKRREERSPLLWAPLPPATPSASGGRQGPAMCCTDPLPAPIDRSLGTGASGWTVRLPSAPHYHGEPRPSIPLAPTTTQMPPPLRGGLCKYECLGFQPIKPPAHSKAAH